MEKAPLLEMRNIRKDFFGNQVLEDMNLTLREGEVIGLVGENGAGKSTLMKILFGADVIRETGGYGGEIILNSEKVSFNSPFEGLIKNNIFVLTDGTRCGMILFVAKRVRFDNIYERGSVGIGRRARLRIL